ncbi:hypothetical protein CCACVL1_22390 [Corchorus capsularis]|uniref:Uncharacterized protein n=1 Tax=Corchorus capsularis TaxID=210143 RepID=A0A1R3GZQ6_COCAP|nr:hypothetical protein CCACVL1_22390 [Corchorus capsularis]
MEREKTRQLTCCQLTLPPQPLDPIFRLTACRKDKENG